MNKKVISIIFVVAIVLQILVPIGMIGYGKIAEENLESKGIEYKFKIYHIDIYNGECSFRLEEDRYSLYLSEYATIGEDLYSGYAYYDQYSEKKPKDKNYIRFTENNYEKLSSFETGMENANFWVIETENAYATIKVYNGDVMVTNVYIENMPVTEWIKAQN